MKQKTTDSTPMPPPAGSSPNEEAIDTATLELLAEWQRQDATDNPEEVHAAEQELAEFKKAMNENRTAAGESALYS